MVTSDGELLMGLGSLAISPCKRPANLAIVVFDNERYGETGMATHTGTRAPSESSSTRKIAAYVYRRRGRSRNRRTDPAS